MKEHYEYKYDGSSLNSLVLVSHPARSKGI